MSVGPVEVVVVKFPGSKFNGEIAPALADAVAQGDVRVLDLVFMTRPNEGKAEIVEIDDLDDDELGDFGTEAAALVDLLSEEDVLAIAESLEVGSSAIAIVFEHAWAARLVTAVRESHGEVLINERIPADVVSAALAAAKA